MKALVTLAALLLAVNVAQAHNENKGAGGNGDISEFHEHAMKGQLEVTPHLNYVTATGKTTGAADRKSNGFNLGSEVEYGVMDRLSVGADLTYRMYKVDAGGGAAKTDNNGLEDIMLFARGSSEMGAGHLAYGLGLGLSLANAKTETNGDTNANTGGMSVKPYVGYEMMAGPGTWGAQLNYTWLGERTAEAGGVETKTKDGNSLGLATFYEYPVNEKTTVGGALTYGMTADSKASAGGTSNNDKANTLGLQVYVPYVIGTDMTLVPHLNWSKADADAATGTDVTTMQIGANLRWMM